MSDITFTADDRMMRTKAAYWVKVKQMPGDIECNQAQAVHITGDIRLHDWWTKPGFPEWFQEDDSWKIDLEVQIMRLPQVLAEILDEAGPREKLGAAKLLFEVADKMPSRSKEIKFADEQINKMDRQQLKAFLDKNLKLVKGKDE